MRSAFLRYGATPFGVVACVLLLCYKYLIPSGSGGCLAYLLEEGLYRCFVGRRVPMLRKGDSAGEAIVFSLLFTVCNAMQGAFSRGGICLLFDVRGLLLVRFLCCS